MKKANKLTAGQNVRWESSRMMLPEHVRALKEHFLEAEKEERPVLEKQLLEEMDRTVREACGNGSPIELRYYDNGMIRKQIGTVIRYDAISRKLIIQPSGNHPESFSLSDIVRISPC